MTSMSAVKKVSMIRGCPISASYQLLVPLRVVSFNVCQVTDDAQVG